MPDVVEVVIRPPRAGDGAGVAQAWLDAGRSYAGLNPDLFQVPGADGLAAWFEEWMVSPHSEDTLLLVADVGGAVVGSVLATIHQPREDAARQLIRALGKVRVEIDSIVVADAYRRQGVGTRLMRAAEGWARGKGAVVSLLSTSIDSPLSVPFSEHRLGYVRRALRFRKELGAGEPITDPRYAPGRPR